LQIDANPKSEIRNPKLNMALKKFKPVTAGTRWRIGNAYAELTTDTPEKSLLEPAKKQADVIFKVAAQCVTLAVVTKSITVL
jgi:hypothetical protein